MGEYRKSHMSRYLKSKVSCYHVMALCTYFFSLLSLFVLIFSVLVFILKKKHVFLLYFVLRSPLIFVHCIVRSFCKKSEVSRWKRLFFLSWEVHKEIITCGQECWTIRCAEKYVLHNLCPEYLKKYLHGYSGSKLVG